MAVMPTLGWRWLLGFLSLPLLLFVAMSYVSIKPFKVFVYFKYIVLLHVSDIFKFWQLKKKRAFLCNYSMLLSKRFCF